jgi:divalent metal cation (Fe/Co/Zn/Cd) transporter
MPAKRSFLLSSSLLVSRLRTHCDRMMTALYSRRESTATVKSHRKATDRERRLEYFTIAWNSVEALVAVVPGILAGSVSMIGLCFDSPIEVASDSALLWRVAIVQENPKRKRRERIALRIVSACFIALALCISFEAIVRLVHKKKRQERRVGATRLS